MRDWRVSTGISPSTKRTGAPAQAASQPKADRLPRSDTERDGLSATHVLPVPAIGVQHRQVLFIEPRQQEGLARGQTKFEIFCEFIYSDPFRGTARTVCDCRDGLLGFHEDYLGIRARGPSPCCGKSLPRRWHRAGSLCP